MEPILGTISKKGGLLGRLDVPYSDPAWNPDDTTPAPISSPVMTSPLVATSGLSQSQLKPILPSITAPLQEREKMINADLTRRMDPKPPATGVLGKIERTASNVGNVLGAIFPGVASGIKGSDVNNQRMINQDYDQLSDISQLKSEEAQRAQTAANTAYLQQRPQIEQAKLMQHLTQTLAPKGFTVTPSTDNPYGFDIAEDPNSQAFKNQQALQQMHDATADKNNLQNEMLQNKYQPGTPQYEEWHRKLEQADQRLRLGLAGLGLRRENLDFNEDKFYNPQPTDYQRKTGDLAQSGLQQLQTMRDIVNRRKDQFGPGAGSEQQFELWLGSEDPDAATYRAAQNFLAEHGAGVFGSRNVHVINDIKNLANQRQNPDALNATFDRAESTFQHFVDAGKTHGRPGNSQSKPASSNVIVVKPEDLK